MKQFNILVVCYANYCRSPVGEKLLQHYLDENFKIVSRGLIQFGRNSMDPRSSKYLTNVGCELINHTTNKLSYNDVENADLILAMDSELIMSLATTFKEAISKFKLFSFCNGNKYIRDPFKLKVQSEYDMIMREINESALKIQENSNTILGNKALRNE